MLKIFFLILTFVSFALANPKVHYKVSYDPDYAPYSYNIDNKPNGLLIDIYKEWGKANNIEVEFVNGKTWDNAITLAKNGKVDFFLGTEPYEKWMQASSPYYKTKTTLFALKSFNGSINKVGIIGDDFKGDLVAKFKNITITSYGTYQELVNALVEQKVDAIYDDEIALGQYILKQSRNHLIRKMDILSHLQNMCAISNDIKKIELFNKGFFKLDKKTLVSLENNWITDESQKYYTTYEQEIFTKKEKEWMDKNPIIRIALMDYWPHDKENNSLHTEILKLINEKSGLSLTPIFFSAWKDGYDKAIKGENLYGIMGLSWSEEREKEHFFYSPAYNFSPCYLVTKQSNKTIQSLKDLEGKTVYLEKDNITHKMLADKNIKIIDMATADDMYKALEKADKVDGFLSYFIDEEKLNQHNLKVTETIYERYGEVAIGINHQYPELNSIINKAFKLIPKETLAQLRNKKWDTKNVVIIPQEQSIPKVSFIGLLSTEEILFFTLIFLLLIYLVYMIFTKSKILNIKFKLFNLTLIGIELVVIIFIISEVTILDRTENTLAKAYKDHHELIKIIDHLRQSSDDLTHFSRTYAVTGDKEFEKRYFTTLDIRNGKIARPKDYDNIYWDLDENIRKVQHPDEKKEALKSMIEKLPFSEFEKAKLKESEDNSNELVKLEVEAFEAIKNNNKELAIQLLHSNNYYKAKNKIMLPIDEVLTALDKRTNQEITILELKIKNQFIYILLISILFIIANLLAYLLLRSKVTIPIEYLTNAIQRFKNNEKIVEKETFYNDEIGYMIKEFFEMKESIEHQKNDLELSKKSTEQILANILFPLLITSREKRVIVYANQFACELYEKSYEDIIDLSLDNLYTLSNGPAELIKKLTNEGKVDSIEEEVTTHSGKRFTALLSVIPFTYHEEECYIGMTIDITKQKEMENAFRLMHKQTRDSIEYASLIQTALIPDNNLFRKYFDEYFVIWHPKDIVGGDIYLFEELRNDDECLLMVIDCTGHGVPGAFVTMLVKAIERQIISKINHNEEEIVSPAEILSIFNRSMKHLLKQEDKNSISNAGFDGQIIYYNKKDKIIKCASARNSIFYLQDDEIIEIKGDRHSVGYNDSDGDFAFTEHILSTSKDISLYISSDGYWDQMGGENERSFGKKRFKNLIETIKDESMAEQQEEFIYTLHDYQGDVDRQDDVTVIAFKIKGE
jgi:PAS domain S-box-containing protein